MNNETLGSFFCILRDQLTKEETRIFEAFKLDGASNFEKLQLQKMSATSLRTLSRRIFRFVARVYDEDNDELGFGRGPAVLYSTNGLFERIFELSKVFGIRIKRKDICEPFGNLDDLLKAKAKLPLAKKRAGLIVGISTRVQRKFRWN